MARNLVVCCDGTGNELTERNTNVGYLFQAIERCSDEQLAFYDAGVGTFSPFGRRVGGFVGRVLGAAFGYGLRRNLEEAYAFLMDEFRDGDRVFLLGFSRGAYTARSLAGMLHKCGLLYPHHANLLPYATAKYFERDNADAAAEFKRVFCRECRPHFVGVWDTVGSLGWLLALRQFHDTRLNPDVAKAVHAVAIDERRRKFPPCLWDEDSLAPYQEVRQEWFAGVHSDVGGGYPERALGDITLAWMLDHAEAAGLEVRAEARAALTPDPLGPMHESWRGWWRLLGRHVREIPEGAPVHPSVRERIDGNVGYAPANLPPAASE